MRTPASVVSASVLYFWLIGREKRDTHAAVIIVDCSNMQRQWLGRRPHHGKGLLTNQRESYGAKRLLACASRCEGRDSGVVPLSSFH